MVLYPNKLPESERVCSGICKIAPATKIQWNERIIGKLVRMAGVSTAQAEFLLPIMETGG